jgi:hypothetical protein
MDYDELKKLAALQLQRNKQGDLNPEPTPEENDYYHNLVGAVAGTISPVSEVGEGYNLAKEALANKAVNQAVDAGSPLIEVARKQQALSRAVDFSNRAKQQSARFERIKALMGK